MMAYSFDEPNVALTKLRRIITIKNWLKIQKDQIVDIMVQAVFGATPLSAALYQLW